MNNGFLQRTRDGRYEGQLTIEGIDISPIEGVFFKQDNKTHLWLKRKPLLEYDSVHEKYVQRPREPRWEAYLEKQGDGTIAYRGKFLFLHFSFSIVAIWDVVLGKDNSRLNFIVERQDMTEQTIINSIRERNERK